MYLMVHISIAHRDELLEIRGGQPGARRQLRPAPFLELKPGIRLSPGGPGRGQAQEGPRPVSHERRLKPPLTDRSRGLTTGHRIPAGFGTAKAAEDRRTPRRYPPLSSLRQWPIAAEGLLFEGAVKPVGEARRIGIQQLDQVTAGLGAPEFEPIGQIGGSLDAIEDPRQRLQPDPPLACRRPFRCLESHLAVGRFQFQQRRPVSGRQP